MGVFSSTLILELTILPGYCVVTIRNTLTRPQSDVFHLYTELQTELQEAIFHTSRESQFQGE